jgi:hypothetical protein
MTEQTQGTLLQNDSSRTRPRAFRMKCVYATERELLCEHFLCVGVSVVACLLHLEVQPQMYRLVSCRRTVAFNNVVIAPTGTEPTSVFDDSI